MTNIQPQTRVFDLKGNETFVTRQSEIHIILFLSPSILCVKGSLTLPQDTPPGHGRQLRAQSMTTHTLRVSSPPKPIPEHWLWWTFVCFARWKLPTETKSLRRNQMAISELPSMKIFNNVPCPHQTLTTRSLLVASPLDLENKGTTYYSFAHLSRNVYHCQRMIWHWAPTVLGKTGAGLWKETPFCGRPRKPRPLISVFCHNIHPLNHFGRRY